MAARTCRPVSIRSLKQLELEEEDRGKHLNSTGKQFPSASLYNSGNVCILHYAMAMKGRAAVYDRLFKGRGAT